MQECISERTVELTDAFFEHFLERKVPQQIAEQIVDTSALLGVEEPVFAECRCGAGRSLTWRITCRRGAGRSLIGKCCLREWRERENELKGYVSE